MYLALQKACKIFSKIQSGKIYVNDLPMIHHTLKIFISDSEMQKALKTVDIDGKFCVFIISLRFANMDVSYMLVRLITNHRKAKFYNMF